MMIGVLLPLLLLQRVSACRHEDVNGFDFLPNMDIQGNNLPDTSPYQPQPGDVQGAATACLERCACYAASSFLGATPVDDVCGHLPLEQ